MRQEMVGFGMQWHQLDHMQTICTLLQTDNQINTPSLNFYRSDTLPDTQPTVSKHCTQHKCLISEGKRQENKQKPTCAERLGTSWKAMFSMADLSVWHWLEWRETTWGVTCFTSNLRRLVNMAAWSGMLTPSTHQTNQISDSTPNLVLPPGGSVWVQQCEE